MFISPSQTNVYADLGEVWLRDQLARLTQKHVQFGGHYPVNADALLGQLAGAARGARAVACGRHIHFEVAEVTH